MAEIGAALREARTRQRIEIAQMEAQTKIRAKYLRALENEEWDLLPGPTYVKSFLRTYGDMLGVDGRQLVAEYKSAHEPFQATDDIGQISKHTGGRMNRQQVGPPIRRLALLAVLLILVVGGGAYALLGRGGGDPAAATTGAGLPASAPETTPDGSGASSTAPASPASRVASVVVTATGPATVCVRAGKRIVAPRRDLVAGQKTTRARGKVVVVTSSSRSVRLSVNGKRRALPAGAAGPVTVSITPTGVRRAASNVTACSVT